MYLMKYLLGLKLINTSERVAYFTKIAGKRRWLVQQQTNKRQLSMSYQQQYVRSRIITSKTIAIRLYLDLLCVFSALVNSAAGTRLRVFRKFWRKICFLLIWKIAFVVMTNMSFQIRIDLNLRSVHNCYLLIQFHLVTPGSVEVFSDDTRS